MVSLLLSFPSQLTKESSLIRIQPFWKMQVRNGGAEAFNKGVVPFFTKKTVPTWGGSVFFVRPDFNKNGNGAPFPKIYEL